MLPNKLYKYRSLDGNCFRFTQSILMQNELWFSKMSDFNDPFEGSFKIDKNTMDEERLQKILSTAIFSKDKAAFCLAEKNDDILMWSHYADSHQGICIEFDTAVVQSIFCNAKKVNYKNEYMEYQSPHDADSVCLIKSNHWGYENEWRIIQDNLGRVSFPAECITGVIMGARISEDNKKWVAKWAELRMPTFNRYQASKSFYGFSLEIR